MVRDCLERKSGETYKKKGDGKRYVLGLAVHLMQNNKVETISLTQDELESDHIHSVRELSGICGIIDSGATRSIGGTDTLRQLAEASNTSKGYDDTVVDVLDNPCFRFGNGETKAAVSTLCLSSWIGGNRDRRAKFAVIVADFPVLIGMDLLDPRHHELPARVHHVSLQVLRLLPVP